MSLTDLAKKMRRSRATVQSHMGKLEESGVIGGYTVRIKPEAEGHRIGAWMGMTLSGNGAPAVLPSLRGEPGVETLHATNGRWDIGAELRADKLELFERVLGRIRSIDGMATTATSIFLSIHKM